MAGAAGALPFAVQNTFRSDEQTLDQILTPPNCRYIIPDYQRPYQWEERHAVAVLKDAQASQEKGYDVHFFSSLLVRKSTSTDPVTGLEEEYFEVVDGQQRMTTWALILGCLHQKYTNHGFVETIERELLMPRRGQEPQKRSKIQLRPADQQFYETNFLRKWLPSPNMEFQDNEHHPQTDVVWSNVHWRMYMNAKAIDAQLQRVSTNLSQVQFNIYVQFLLHKCKFVKIVTQGALRFAHDVFSILNARGIQLSFLDTIKPFWAAKYIDSPQRKDNFAARWEELEASFPEPTQFERYFETFRLIEESRRVHNPDPGQRIAAAQANLRADTYDYFKDKVEEKSVRSDILDDFADKFFESLEVYRELVSSSGFTVDHLADRDLEATQLLNHLLCFLNRMRHAGWIASLVYFFGQHPDPRSRVVFTYAVERMNFSLHVLHKSAVNEQWFSKLCYLQNANTLDDCLEAMRLKDADISDMKANLFPTPAIKNPPVLPEIAKYLLFRLEFEEARRSSPVRRFDPPSLEVWNEAAVDHILPLNHLSDAGGKNVTTWGKKRDAAGEGVWWIWSKRKKWYQNMENLVLLNHRLIGNMTSRSLDENVILSTSQTPLPSKRALYGNFGAHGKPFIFTSVMGPGRFDEDSMERRRDVFIKSLVRILQDTHQNSGLRALRQHFGQ